MKKVKLTRSLLAACSIVALSAVMYAGVGVGAGVAVGAGVGAGRGVAVGTASGLGVGVGTGVCDGGVGLAGSLVGVSVGAGATSATSLKVAVGVTAAAVGGGVGLTGGSPWQAVPRTIPRMRAIRAASVGKVSLAFMLPSLWDRCGSILPLVQASWVLTSKVSGESPSATSFMGTILYL